MQAMLPLRRAAVAKAASLAEGVAASLSRQPLALALQLTELEGTLRVWLPPPPSSRCVRRAAPLARRLCFALEARSRCCRRRSR
jgi:hypothetical protein